MSPCESTPRRLANRRFAAINRASFAGTPSFSKQVAQNSSSCDAGTFISFMRRTPAISSDELAFGKQLLARSLSTWPSRYDTDEGHSVMKRFFASLAVVIATAGLLRVRAAETEWTPGATS